MDHISEFDIAKKYFQLGLEFYGKESYLEAEKNFILSLKYFPNRQSTLTNLIATLLKLEKYEQAEDVVTKTLSLFPNDAILYLNYGKIYEIKFLFREALDCYLKAIKINSKYTEAYMNAGIVCFELGENEDAFSNYEKAIEINPYLDQIYINRGNLYLNLNLLDKAFDDFEKAINISPKSADAFFSMGNLLTKQKNFDMAIIYFEKALSIRPDFAEALFNIGNNLSQLKRYEEALTYYLDALQIKPHLDYFYGTFLYTKMLICNWHDRKNNIDSLISSLNNNKKVSLCLPLLALTDKLDIQFKVAKSWSRNYQKISPIDNFKSRKSIANQICIGYYSADFHNHATAYLMAELFEKHNKDRFKFIAFSYGPNTKDEMQQRLMKVFQEFIDVSARSDFEVASMSRALGIDIAIDLKGYTEDARTGIFAYRAAPIQVSYIGYPGTMATDYIDYIIADKTLIPSKTQKYYSEKIVYLPDCYQPNDRERLISDKKFAKEQFGLPQDSFIFCCFNNNYKITPETFDRWLNILKVVKGGVLWLLEDNPPARQNLRSEALARGINPDRLVFAQRIELSEHLARHKLADLFLDTLPYNAHTTASDALWAGLPVLTLMGESFASRVAASLLHAIELPELITTNTEQYEAKAIELATNPAKLKAIKDKLERNRLTTALFDTPRFTKNLEAAYTKMYERYQADLPPDHIYIEQ